MLTAQERSVLKSLSNKLKDLVYVGKEGLTNNVITQINDNLYAHELIKIKVQKTASDDISSIAKEIEDKCDCEVVATIGSKILLYKVTSKPKFEHLL